jgi:hypothetical protein
VVLSRSNSRSLSNSNTSSARRAISYFFASLLCCFIFPARYSTASSTPFAP